MTYHYINLISWRFFKNSMHGSQLNIDSISLQILLLLHGVKISRKAGVTISKDNKPNRIYLIDRKIENEKCIILPYYANLEEVSITQEVIEEIKDFDSIIIGISSPKQDKLARIIHSNFPEKEIYCLGAAVYETNHKMNFIGLSWLFFLIKKPKRTLKKLKITIAEFFKILLIKKQNEDFKAFKEHLTTKYRNQ